MNKSYYAVKNSFGDYTVRTYGDNPRNTMTMTQAQLDSFMLRNEVKLSHSVIDHKLMLEASYMAELAASHIQSRAGVTPEMYWDAGMAVLKEAYGVAS
jgi:hypothetical protein